MHRRLRICSYFQELSPIHSLPCDSEIVDIDLKEHLINAVLNNCGILNQNNNNWSKLSFLEKPTTLRLWNYEGLKASKKLDLFI